MATARPSNGASPSKSAFELCSQRAAVRDHGAGAHDGEIVDAAAAKTDSVPGWAWASCAAPPYHRPRNVLTNKMDTPCHRHEPITTALS